MKLTKKNIITSFILQMVTILYGLILPKIILSYFGSEVNGLITSITQLLNYIQILEGGLASVVMASLYKPLLNKDHKRISAIIKATRQFFKKIGFVYILYSIVIGFLYPLYVRGVSSFSYTYVLCLVLIISISTFIQYFFSLTYKILINADKHSYVVSITHIIFMLLNLIFVFISVKVYPQIFIVKAICSITFIIQPVVFSIYVSKNYRLDKKVELDSEALSQRWDGFGQNLAYFIHTNTDVVLLTFLTTFSQVSVYSVFYMVVIAIKNFQTSLSTAVAPSLGRIIATEDANKIKNAFSRYEFGIYFITTILYSACCILIQPFVSLYTNNLTDANYYQPVFGIILTIAYAIYGFRDPFINILYASGHIKSTAKYAYIEAGLNIVLSLVLISWLGLLGVAIGTAIAMLYRMIAMVMYLKKNIIFRPAYVTVLNILPFVLSGIIISAFTILFVKIEITSYLYWVIFAVIVVITISLVLSIVLIIFKRKDFIDFIKYIVFRKKHI